MRWMLLLFCCWYTYPSYYSFHIYIMGHGYCLLHADAASLQASPCIERYFTATPCDAYNIFSCPIFLLPVLPVMNHPSCLWCLCCTLAACTTAYDAIFNLSTEHMSFSMIVTAYDASIMFQLSICHFCLLWQRFSNMTRKCSWSLL